MQIRPSPQRIEMDSRKEMFNKLSKPEKIAVVVIAFTLSVFFTFLENWLIMIAIGSIHSIFNSVPAVGFWTVFWANIIITFIIRTIFRKTK